VGELGEAFGAGAHGGALAGEADRKECVVGTAVAREPEGGMVDGAIGVGAWEFRGGVDRAWDGC